MAINNNSGIIFADLFINNKELFVKFFEQYYIEKKNILDPIILELEKVLMQYGTQKITAAMASSFKIAWQNFQQYVLLNTQNLQLLVAYRGYQGKNAQFSQIIDQSAVEGVVNGSYGINTGNELIKSTMAVLQAQKVEEFLQKHLNDFLNQLEKKISKSEAHSLHRYHSYLLHNDFKQKEAPHITGLPWRAPFYGVNSQHYFGGQGLGQAYDAFMQHLANYNNQIFTYLSSNGTNNYNVELNTKPKDTVFNEEGGVEKTGHFPKLLNESKNRIGWYTGGDIIIVDPQTLSIVYNIQLKTTTANKPSLFAEKVQAIRNFIKGFKIATPREKGERLFDFLLTSVSNRNDFNTMPQTTIDDIVKNTLLNKLNNNNIQINL